MLQTIGTTLLIGIGSWQIKEGRTPKAQWVGGGMLLAGIVLVFLPF